jgi:hypothetical protein
MIHLMNIQDVMCLVLTDDELEHSSDYIAEYTVVRMRVDLLRVTSR